MTNQLNMRVRPETRLQIADLGRRWSSVKPLTASEVVRECVRRVHEIEAKHKEKRR